MKMQVQAGFRATMEAPENTSLNTIFPGVTSLPGGELLSIYTTGSDFESADQLPFYSLSNDAGQHWTAGNPLFQEIRLPSGGLFSCCCKPTVYGDRVIAVGYGFERDDLTLSLSDYATRYGRFPKCRNFVCFSETGKGAWNSPRFIEHAWDGIEISGPALTDALGQLHFFGPPFVLRGQVQRGLNYVSRDGGMSWQEQSQYFEHPDIAPWETRTCLLPNGRIWLVFWAYDLASEKHLNNILVYSDDNGQSWSEPLDSGIHCQAANLLALPEYPELMLFVGTVREGNNPGIVLHLLNGVTGECLDSQVLLTLENMCNAAGNIEVQFANLRFGQPGLLLLPDGDLLLSHWSKINQRYACQCRKFSFRLQK